jgi:hypothetical protein
LRGPSDRRARSVVAPGAGDSLQAPDAARASCPRRHRRAVRGADPAPRATR